MCEIPRFRDNIIKMLSVFFLVNHDLRFYFDMPCDDMGYGER